MERSPESQFGEQNNGLRPGRGGRARRYWTLVTIVAVLGLGVLPGVIVWRAGGIALDATKSLTSRDTPMLARIADMQTALREQTAILSAYAATGDRSTYRARFDTLDMRNAATLALISNDELTGIYGRYLRVARALDAALAFGTAPASLQVAQLHDMARNLTARIEAQLQAEHARLTTRVAHAAARAESSLGRAGSAALLLGVVVVLSVVTAGWAWWRRRDDALRRMLAGFPEHDPNPVLRLSPLGAIQYANPGARALLTCLGIPDDGPLERILPPDLPALLPALRDSHSPTRVVEYDAGPLRLEARLQYLSDLDCIHLYIADVSERRAAEERLIHDAYHDPLTGLPNRRRFDEAIGDVLYGRARHGMRVALLVIGLDRLKNVVESLGHATRDELLRDVGSRLKGLAREQHNGVADIEPYRFDGGLFALLIPGYTQADQPIRCAERVREALRGPYYAHGREIVVTASIGVAVYPLDGQDGATILKNADAAMQGAKDDGGDRVRCYTHDMNVHANEIFALEHHLRHALELNELELVYQPQFEIRTNRLVGVEALLRWRHPDRGLIAPARFIPLAEETGLILSIGDWTLRAAAATLRACRDAGMHDLVVAVNVSGRQLREQNFAQRVAQVLRDASVPPAGMELEITESVAMHDVEETITLLDQIKALGVRIAVDDFGTGFSSLSYLTRFPVDRLKVDQSFARHVTDHLEDAAVARAVTELGHSLGLTVIAEGVETAAQLAFFQRTRCDEYQGFYGGMPMSADDILRRYRPDPARAAV